MDSTQNNDVENIRLNSSEAETESFPALQQMQQNEVPGFYKLLDPGLFDNLTHDEPHDGPHDEPHDESNCDRESEYENTTRDDIAKVHQMLGTIHMYFPGECNFVSILFA